MKKIKLLFFSILVLTTGCVPVYIPPVPQNFDPATTKMTEAASAVTDSLQTLETIRKTQVPIFVKRLPNPYAPGMTRVSSIDWTGPIGPLMRNLAEASGYKLRVLGTPPAIPIIIFIQKTNVTLGEIIRDADFQAGRKAHVVVYPRYCVIELRYRNY